MGADLDKTQHILAKDHTLSIQLAWRIVQPEHKTVHETHTTDTPWCARPWTLDDLLFIKPFISQAANMMSVCNTEKAKTQPKCQDKRNASQMKEQDKVITREMEGTLPNSFYEASTALSPNWTKTPLKRKTTDQSPWWTWMQKFSTKISKLGPTIHTNNYSPQWVGFIPGMHNQFNICKSTDVIHHIDKRKDNSHMILSIDAEKAFDKMQHPFLMKKKHSWKEG